MTTLTPEALAEDLLMGWTIAQRARDGMTKHFIRALTGYTREIESATWAAAAGDLDAKADRLDDPLMAAYLHALADGFRARAASARFLVQHGTNE
jgi:hypothetical protein